MDWKCPACGTLAKMPDDFKRAACFCGFVQYNNPPGLGDRVAATLAKMGVTEKRYTNAKRALGLKGACGCKKRQRALNKLGRKPQ